MGAAKEIRVAPISSADARRLIRALHYSHKIVANSRLHFGVFLEGRCGGALQFGPSLAPRKVIGLVSGTPWYGMLELNRMAFADWLPRNSESRALAYALRFIRAHYPHIQWVLSFADGTQCGDGTQYRAAGFSLIGIKKNTSIWATPGGEKFTDVGLRTGRGQREKARQIIVRTTIPGNAKANPGGSASMKYYREAGWAPLPGYQLKYIYFLHPTARQRLTVPILPFSEIARRGAGMYRGKPRAGSIDADAPAHQAGEGGSIPTPALQT